MAEPRSKPTDQESWGDWGKLIKALSARKRTESEGDRENSEVPGPVHSSKERGSAKLKIQKGHHF